MKSSVFSLFWRLILRPRFSSFAGIFFLALAVAVTSMATIGLGVPLINTAMGTPEGRTARILTLLVVISLVAILNSLLLFLQQYGTVKVAHNAFCDLKGKLFDRLLKAQFSALSQRGRGALLYDMTQPSQGVFQMIDLFGRMALNGLTTLSLVGLMFYFSWSATLGVGLLGLVWWLKLKNVLGSLSSRLGRKIYEINREIECLDVDAIDGVKEVKSHGLESCLEERQKSLLQAQRKPKLMVDLLTRGVYLLNEGAAGIVVITLGFLALKFNLLSMSFSQLIAFMLAIRRVSPSLGTFHSMYLQFSRELKNLEVAEELLTLLPQERSGGKKPDSVESIQFRAVSFSYPSKPGQWALSGVSLQARRGEITAIVGPSGSGKSTLARLLLSFYEPVQGEIFVNGVALSELDLSFWRGKVGYVSQDLFLFNDTIFNNIALWNPSVSQKEVEGAAKLAQLDDFIQTLPQGYQTPVGDRGLRLSGGQCQRVAIAREVLKKPEVLIFDEATSALDNLTEKAVYEAIQFLRRDALVLVIAHRLTTIREADQIVVLKEGRVEALGNHEALLKQGGLYAELYV